MQLNLIATVHQTQPTIQKLLNTSDFVGALDMIYTTQDVLAQELTGIHSFRCVVVFIIKINELFSTNLKKTSFTLNFDDCLILCLCFPSFSLVPVIENY